jgi:Asp-tRNA(Asn)/Glu-tRNA(Gln) amidotransferase C subunit
MSLTQEKINTLKKLTSLKGGESLNIESVLDSFETLQVKNIELNHAPTRSGQGTLIPREDRVYISTASSDDLLHCSPQKVIAHQISLSSIMHGE